MEPLPTLPSPQFEAKPGAQESAPVIPNVENVPNTGAEQGREAAVKNAATSTDNADANNTTNGIATPQVPAAPVTNTPSATNPAIADDVDVIEKEWVERAKKIVGSTKQDPHLQEKEVSKLQADYLLKRYGKKIKLTE